MEHNTGHGKLRRLPKQYREIESSSARSGGNVPVDHPAPSISPESSAKKRQRTQMSNRPPPRTYQPVTPELKAFANSMSAMELLKNKAYIETNHFDNFSELFERHSDIEAIPLTNEKAMIRYIIAMRLRPSSRPDNAETRPGEDRSQITSATNTIKFHLLRHHVDQRWVYNLQKVWEAIRAGRIKFEDVDGYVDKLNGFIGDPVPAARQRHFPAERLQTPAYAEVLHLHNPPHNISPHHYMGQTQPLPKMLPIAQELSTESPQYGQSNHGSFQLTGTDYFKALIRNQTSLDREASYVCPYPMGGSSSTRYQENGSSYIQPYEYDVSLLNELSQPQPASLNSSPSIRGRFQQMYMYQQR